MTELTAKQTLERLRRVETRQRRLYLVGAGGIALLLAAMAGDPQDAPSRRDVLEVRELRVTHDGATRIQLGVDAAGAASIVIRDPSGTRRVALTAPVGGAARIDLFGPDGEPQPLIRQIAAEADALGREAARELERDVRESIGTEIDRVRDVLSAWRSNLIDQPEPQLEVHAETLVMRIVADRDDAGIDLGEQQRRLRAWLAEHREARADPAAIDRFRALSADAGGPTSDAVRWFPHLIAPMRDDPERWQFSLSRRDGYFAVAAFDDGDWNDGRVGPGRTQLMEYLPLRMDGEPFTGRDLDRTQIRIGSDDLGRPALTYAMRPDRQADFADWSEANVGRVVAVVVEGRVISAPRFMSRIEGRAQITGEFTRAEIEELARRLRAGAR